VRFRIQFSKSQDVPNQGMPNQGMPNQDMPPRSRGAMRPSCARLWPRNTQRAQGKPGAYCTRSLVRNTTGSTGSVRLSPRNGFSGLLRALPGDRALLPPSSLRSLLLKNLTPASGRQDHTTSPSASVPLVWRHCRVHRIPHPTSVTIAIRPSSEAGIESLYSCFYQTGKRKIFRKKTGQRNRRTARQANHRSLSFVELRRPQTGSVPMHDRMYKEYRAKVSASGAERAYTKILSSASWHLETCRRTLGMSAYRVPALSLAWSQMWLCLTMLRVPLRRRPSHLEDVFTFDLAQASGHGSQS
jgi:hypothetical protein